MSKTNTTNSEDKMLTDVLYCKLIEHDNILEFKSNISDYFDNQKLKDEYLSNKDYYDSLQHIYLFIYVDYNVELLKYLKNANMQNGVFTFTFNYSKFIENNKHLEDRIVKFFIDTYYDDTPKYLKAIKLFCSGNLDTQSTLYSKLKRNEDIVND